MLKMDRTGSEVKNSVADAQCASFFAVPDKNFDAFWPWLFPYQQN
jgi:hypothetical protein